MAQAILDLHANAEDTAELEEGELPATSSSGPNIDNIHIFTTKYNRTERKCSKPCYESVALHRIVGTIQRRSYVYICCSTWRATMCCISVRVGIFCLTWIPPLSMVGLETMTRNWQSCRRIPTLVRRFIAGLLDVTPGLPARLKDPRRDCIPNKRQVALTHQWIPKVSIAAVGTKGFDGSVGDTAWGAEISKVSKSPLITRLEVRYHCKEP